MVEVTQGDRIDVEHHDLAELSQPEDQAVDKGAALVGATVTYVAGAPLCGADGSMLALTCGLNLACALVATLASMGAPPTTATPTASADGARDLADFDRRLRLNGKRDRRKE